MKSQTLDFEYLWDLKWFAVTFESESKEKNLLMSVVMEGYPIDTVDLRTSHKVLYRAIENKMSRVANDFWDNQKTKAFGKLPNMASLAQGFFNKIKTV